jgi:CheY-like chemotaxis protein
MRILVVDDEPLVAQTLALVFEQNGFEVAIAPDAENALDQLRAAAPDLIVCDIDLPGRDGISLMTEIGRDLPELPILVLTGFYSALGRIRDCAGNLPQAVSIHTKPCSPQDLIKTAGSLLRIA